MIDSILFNVDMTGGETAVCMAMVLSVVQTFEPDVADSITDWVIEAMCKATGNHRIVIEASLNFVLHNLEAGHTIQDIFNNKDLSISPEESLARSWADALIYESGHLQ